SGRGTTAITSKKAFCALIWNLADNTADIVLQSLGRDPTVKSVWDFLAKRARSTASGTLFGALTCFFHFDASHCDSIEIAWQTLENKSNELRQLSIPNESEFNAAPWLFTFAFLRSSPKESEVAIAFLKPEMSKTSLEETYAYLCDEEHRLKSRNAKTHRAPAAVAAI
ncbi:MAG: hypothetical protein CYPHOPRED_001687, partial [Cyphobasidiales sp. Tagirdzhanova-0007]